MVFNYVRVSNFIFLKKTRRNSIDRKIFCIPKLTFSTLNPHSLLIRMYAWIDISWNKYPFLWWIQELRELRKFCGFLYFLHIRIKKKYLSLWEKFFRQLHHIVTRRKCTIVTRKKCTIVTRRNSKCTIVMPHSYWKEMFPSTNFGCTTITLGLSDSDKLSLHV